MTRHPERVMSFSGGVSVDVELWAAALALRASRTRDGWWGVARYAYDDAVAELERRVDLASSSLLGG
jgi:hypothetical protein